jgi:hypothetical protein
MASGMNWNRVRYEKKIREQGYAPAEDPRPASKSKLAEAQKLKASSSKSRKPKKKRSLIERREATRRSYITAIKKAIAENKPAPPSFKKLDPRIKEEISELGPELWAQHQPEFKRGQGTESKKNDLLTSEKLKKFRQLRAEVEDIEAKIAALRKQYEVSRSKLEKKKKVLNLLS